MTQEKALELLKSGQNVFLTGQAGSGKTYVINQYIRYLHAHQISVAITASTGIAATHIGGVTIHSWSGMGIKDNLSQSQMATLKTRGYLRKRYNAVKVLILDEISMLHRRQFELLDELLRYMKGQPFLPFGGVQVVLSGDFLQLPPVSKENEPMRERFCFMSPSFADAGFKICYLHTQYRQGDNTLSSILNEIRQQELTETTYNTLQEKITTYQEEEENARTRLYTHNLDVDRLNEKFIRSLTTKEKFFKADKKGNKSVIEKYESYGLVPFELLLKIGARVMFIKNHQEGLYNNGTVGTVIDFSKEGYPIVKTVNGDEIEAKLDSWTIEDDKGDVIVTILQVPLKLAWAVTIHKSQGMTLDSAEIDLTKTFEPGQGYVALSRLKDIDGLHLKGINNTALQLDGLAYKADRRFTELSKEHETEYTEQELNQKRVQFIRQSGGVLEPKTKERKASKLPPLKKKKVPTLEVTRELLEKKMTIAEIAKERDFSPKTIFGHVNKLVKQYPDLDVDHLKPSEHILQMVEQAMLKHYPSKESLKEFKLKKVFEELNGEVSYDDIKLSIPFLSHLK